MTDIVLRAPPRLINPAQDYVGGKLYYGVWATVSDGEEEKDTMLLVSSDREYIDVLDVEQMAARGFRTRPLAIFESRWSIQSVNDFLRGRVNPERTEPYQMLVKLLKRHFEFQDPREYSLVAVWVLGTYLVCIFRSYPYLSISGMKRVGKSKLLSFLEQTCFNPVNSADISDPSLFRMVDSLRATILLDEAATLESREAKRSQKQLLWAGYKRGAKAVRSEKTPRGTIAPLPFELFSAKVFVTFEGAEEITADRSIPITLIRSSNPRILNSEIREDDPEWQKLRDLCYVWGMTYFQKIVSIYNSCPEIELPEFTGRERELWAPLLSIAYFLGRDVFENLVELARDKVRAKQLEDIQSYRELKVLEALVLMSRNWGDEEHLVSSSAVKGVVDTLLEDSEERKWMSTQRIQRILRSSFGLPGVAQARRVLRRVTKQRVLELAKRYDLDVEKLLADERELLRRYLRERLVAGKLAWEELAREAREAYDTEPREIFELLDELSEELKVQYRKLSMCPKETQRTVDGRRVCSNAELPPCGVADPEHCPLVE